MCDYKELLLYLKKEKVNVNLINVEKYKHLNNYVVEKHFMFKNMCFKEYLFNNFIKNADLNIYLYNNKNNQDENIICEKFKSISQIHKLIYNYIIDNINIKNIKDKFLINNIIHNYIHNHEYVNKLMDEYIYRKEKNTKTEIYFDMVKNKKTNCAKILNQIPNGLLFDNLNKPLKIINNNSHLYHIYSQNILLFIIYNNKITYPLIVDIFYHKYYLYEKLKFDILKNVEFMRKPNILFFINYYYINFKFEKISKYINVYYKNINVFSVNVSTNTIDYNYELFNFIKNIDLNKEINEYIINKINHTTNLHTNIFNVNYNNNKSNIIKMLLLHHFNLTYRFKIYNNNLDVYISDVKFCVINKYIKLFWNFPIEIIIDNSADINDLYYLFKINKLLCPY